jgi:dTDP-4-dehydrorhamnose reductase
MILSRRSFLKLAGLTTVAAASASMFTGCGAFSTTPITVVAAKDSTKEFVAAVAELNKKKLVENGFTPLPTWQDALARYLKEIEF